MSKQPEALRAADWIEHHAPMLTLERPMEAADAIRRLQSLNAELVEALILMVRTHDEPAESLLQEMKEQQWIEKARAALAKAEAQQ